MSRTVLIMVCDNHEQIETAKKYWETNDVTFQVYSTLQWREGLDSSFFRQQLMQGLPALVSGSAPLNTDAHNNIIPFTTGQVPEARVQKMEQMEAKAIEDAIYTYKGNLTEAAKALGIGRATLYRKVKQYQIDPSAARKKKIVAA